MKMIIILIVSNLLAHSGFEKHHQKFKYNYICSVDNHYNYRDCNLCNHIVDSYILNGHKTFIIKINKFLSKFEKRVLKKKLRKHLGFHSKIVKFRFTF